MLIIGLTGSIGMGKTVAARAFAAAGVPVHDADVAVHSLYEGEAIAPIEREFPGTTTPQRVDRTRLGARVLDDPAAMRRLEAIVHPLVRAAEAKFLADARARGARIAVLDVPLLFETGGEARVDAVVVVSATAPLQRARVLARKGMTAEKFDAILSQQMPDSEKRARAHFVIETSGTLESTAVQVRGILRALAAMPSGPPRAARTAEQDS